MMGLAFERRRKRREKTLKQVSAETPGVTVRSFVNYERDRLYGVPRHSLPRINVLNRRWTIEDYENGTSGVIPTWPRHGKLKQVGGG